MHCQILTFTLDEMTDDLYARICHTLEAECRGLQGLVAQRWAVNPATHTLAGMLRWQSHGGTGRARRAAEHMNAALHYSPTQVTERIFRQPEGAATTPTSPRAPFTSEYDPRG
jgi:hypothetical protein